MFLQVFVFFPYYTRQDCLLLAPTAAINTETTKLTKIHQYNDNGQIADMSKASF
jgi:hypothetical protein